MFASPLQYSWSKKMRRSEIHAAAERLYLQSKWWVILNFWTVNTRREGGREGGGGKERHVPFPEGDITLHPGTRGKMIKNTEFCRWVSRRFLSGIVVVCQRWQSDQRFTVSFSPLVLYIFSSSPFHITVIIVMIYFVSFLLYLLLWSSALSSLPSTMTLTTPRFCSSNATYPLYQPLACAFPVPVRPGQSGRAFQTPDLVWAKTHGWEHQTFREPNSRKTMCRDSPALESSQVTLRSGNS